MVLTSSTFELSARTLLEFLTSAGQKPNLLIVCSSMDPDEVVQSLLKWCALPLRYYALPGVLRLPSNRRGTLLLQPIDALTMTQQISLYDWMNLNHEGPQIVSVATRPLEPLVMRGRFLEALFHGLNELSLDVRSGESSRSWLDRLSARHDGSRIH